MLVAMPPRFVLRKSLVEIWSFLYKYSFLPLNRCKGKVFSLNVKEKVSKKNTFKVKKFLLAK